MLTVNVELGERGYPIVIGAGLLGDQGLAAKRCCVKARS